MFHGFLDSRPPTTTSRSRSRSLSVAATSLEGRGQEKSSESLPQRAARRGYQKREDYQGSVGDPRRKGRGSKASQHSRPSPRTVYHHHDIHRRNPSQRHH